MRPLPLTPIASKVETLPPLLAVESSHVVETHSAWSRRAKIVHVVEGEVTFDTHYGPRNLGPGMAISLGSGQPSRMQPQPFARVWTIYVDEEFLRVQMAWFLPDMSRVRLGVHPDEWDGGPLVMNPGIAIFAKLEPLWREMSVLRAGAVAPEAKAARMIELFARWVGLVMPVFLTSAAATDTSPSPQLLEVLDHRADIAAPQIEAAARLLQQRMGEQWTLPALAQAVSLSRTHLGRQFLAQMGTSPMRFLTEIRVTELTRLIDETDLSLAQAAAAVGWRDPRVAASWFRRRHNMLPSEFRHRRASAIRDSPETVVGDTSV